MKTETRKLNWSFLNDFFKLQQIDAVAIYYTNYRMCPMCDKCCKWLKTLAVKNNLELLECMFCHTIFVYEKPKKEKQHHYIQFAHGLLNKQAKYRDEMK